MDDSGNIYIADTQNNRIRMVTASTGIISTVAGNGTVGYSGDGGAATSAELTYPNGVAVDSVGNIYIADTQNNRIREVTASTGNISTVAGNGTFGYSGDGGAATSAELTSPMAWPWMALPTSTSRISIIVVFARSRHLQASSPRWPETAQGAIPVTVVRLLAQSYTHPTAWPSIALATSTSRIQVTMSSAK